MLWKLSSFLSLTLKLNKWPCVPCTILCSFLNAWNWEASSGYQVSPRNWLPRVGSLYVSQNTFSAFTVQPETPENLPRNFWALLSTQLTCSVTALKTLFITALPTGFCFLCLQLTNWHVLLRHLLPVCSPGTASRKHPKASVSCFPFAPPFSGSTTLTCTVFSGCLQMMLHIFLFVCFLAV